MEPTCQRPKGGVKREGAQGEAGGTPTTRLTQLQTLEEPHTPLLDAPRFLGPLGKAGGADVWDGSRTPDAPRRCTLSSVTF